MSNKLSLQINNEYKFYHHTSHDDNFYLIKCKKIPQDSNLNDHYDYDDRGFFYEHLNENFYVMYKLISHASVLNLLNGIEIDESILKRESLNLNQRLHLEQELKKITLPSHFLKFYVPEKDTRTDYSGSINSFHDHNSATLVIDNPTHFDNGLHHQQNGTYNNQQQLDNNIPNDHHLQQQAPQHTPEGISLFQDSHMNYNNVGYNNYVTQDAIGDYTHQQQVDSYYTLLPSDDHAPVNGGYTQRHTNLLHENNGSKDTTNQNCDFILSPNNNNIAQTSHPQHPQHQQHQQHLQQQVDQNNISQEMRSTYSYENNELPRIEIGNCIYSPQQQHNNFPHHQYFLI
ncbi:hypothetical protein RhiirA4_493568 [Rhizophagus irregularis]|uniref:Uncharacterized protein n=1 Tax=Rhizophagus irregularis TaxID=588596 RepID=A0A2I1G1A3_9GLOM|nr:hypothetical protein RhiirA4_493568 [Rhizophagus irregularis]